MAPPLRASVAAIEYHLPDNVLTTEQLASEFPDWSVEKIDSKTGIAGRHIAADDECASDLACQAALKLFASGACKATDIDFLLFCTQTPDYLLPTTACLLQDRLGIPTSAGALDFNLGCSGYIYGLGLAQGLIETGQARNVLLLTGETYSKLLDPDDRSVRTIFGDAGAATLVRGVETSHPLLGPYVYGTDGSGGKWLIAEAGGMRSPARLNNLPTLRMDGMEIFSFTLSAVPSAVHAILEKARLDVSQIDLFVFHQANKHMLENLRRKTGLPAERFVISMGHCGNTVSSTIPIALRDASGQGLLHDGATLMLVGFGVGLSWGATILKWKTT